MTLLDLYLGAVNTYLPKGSDRRDILAELREHLESTMDERATQLGRRLTESEQEAVLARFGAPFTVASRYGRTGPGFAIGPFQLMSPMTFPVYVGVMVSVLAAGVIINIVMAVLAGASVMSVLRIIGEMTVFFLLVLTPVFAGIDYFLRRSGRKQRGAPESWLFWTPYLKYVPRWYSASGLVLMSVFTIAWGLWWSTWPQVPALLFGPAARALTLSPEWQRFQLFLLGLLLVAAGQRAFSLVRPELTLVPWIARLVVNLLCVALLYPMLHSAPFVAVQDAVAVSDGGVELARNIDNATRGWIRGFGFYWVINTLWIAFICGIHILYRTRHGRQSGLGERPQR